MNFILAIDDMPVRYKHFKPKDVFVPVCCRVEDFWYYVDRHQNKYDKIIGILLDHDMPYADGKYFAKEIGMNLHVPVALTSNNQSGRVAMRDILEQFAVPVVDADITWANWDKIALKHFGLINV